MTVARHAEESSSTRTGGGGETLPSQTEDCPLDLHMKERYRGYRRFLRDFPQTYDPEIDENGETVDDYKLPETLEEFALETKV